MFLREIAENRSIWASLLSWAIAQIIKVIIDLGRYKKVNAALLISSGGMPSSHTAFVVAMMTAIGITEGFNSSLFAVSSVLALVVMYDAAGVRRAAGKQAKVLNLLVESLEQSGVKLDKKLKEMLGHTPIEVGAGAILGILVAWGMLG